SPYRTPPTPCTYASYLCPNRTPLPSRPSFCFLRTRLPPRSTLFPYTTLFPISGDRSGLSGDRGSQRGHLRGGGGRAFQPAHLEPVAEHEIAAFGEHGLGVELDAEERLLAVLDGHDDAVLGARGHLELLEVERLVDDRQRMVAGHRQRVRAAEEEALLVVGDDRCLAVHEHGRMRHLRAEDLAEGLMAQADAEDGQIGGLGP